MTTSSRPPHEHTAFIRNTPSSDLSHALESIRMIQPSPSFPEPPTLKQPSRISSPIDVLRYLKQTQLRLQPGDTLALLLTLTHVPIGHLQYPASPLHPQGPGLQDIFHSAFTHHAARLLLLTVHPTCRNGPFMPSDQMCQLAARFSLAGQLLDLRLIDYLICNDTNLQSLILNFRDELYRYALFYSQQQANPLSHVICQN